MQDPAAGLALVASAGVRRGGRGEALLALSLRPGEVLFAVDRADARGLPRALAVNDLEVALSPLRLAFDGRLAAHRGPFPPGPVPLLLTPREVAVRIDLRFAPATPAVDFCRGLPDDVREALAPLGAHHVEQSGAWTGTVEADGRGAGASPARAAATTRGAGATGRAADWWRLFTMRLGDDVAVHALVVSARGRVVEGGFVWRDGRAERIVRVQFAPRREGDVLRGLELELTTAGGPPLRIHGEVERSITVPVDLDRRLHRHLAGRPWRLLLDENFTRYEGLGRRGHGMAEITRTIARCRPGSTRPWWRRSRSRSPSATRARALGARRAARRAGGAGGLRLRAGGRGHRRLRVARYDAVVAGWRPSACRWPWPWCGRRSSWPRWRSRGRHGAGSPLARAATAALVGDRARPHDRARRDARSGSGAGRRRARGWACPSATSWAGR